MRHIKKSEPNYLWVSNEAALHLMHEGLSTPETGSPTNNPHFDMIDAQLTTEIFGFFALVRVGILLLSISLTRKVA